MDGRNCVNYYPFRAAVYLNAAYQIKNTNDGSNETSDIRFFTAALNEIDRIVKLFAKTFRRYQFGKIFARRE